MCKQRSLPFDWTDSLELVWRGAPAPVREQVLTLYAGLIARNLRGKVRAPLQAAASVSHGLVGRPAAEGINGALGSGVAAKRSPEALLESPGAAITVPIPMEPDETTICHFGDASGNQLFTTEKEDADVRTGI